MIQTSYVSLEHPYRIIEYSGTVGLQIGTLVVTRETEGADGGYGIETHSHPVVSYANPQVERKQMGQNVYNGFSSGQVEGVVWDKVEVSEVVTLGREGDSISWNDLMDNCRNLWYVGKWDSQVMGLLKVGEYWDSLLRLGMTIDYPMDLEGNSRMLVVELIKEKFGNTDYCIAKSCLGLITPVADNDEMYVKLSMQIKVYDILVKMQRKISGLEVSFMTDEENFRRLASMLNDSQQWTRSGKHTKGLLIDNLGWEGIVIEQNDDKVNEKKKV